MPKIIIDIPERIHYGIEKGITVNGSKASQILIDAVKNGTPLPKGHWILIDKELSRYKCSECGEVIRLYKKSEISKLEKDEILSDYPFSHCGAKMIEPQESEGNKE